MLKDGDSVDLDLEDIVPDADQEPLDCPGEPEHTFEHPGSTDF